TPTTCPCTSRGCAAGRPSPTTCRSRPTAPGWRSGPRPGGPSGPGVCSCSGSCWRPRRARAAVPATSAAAPADRGRSGPGDQAELGGGGQAGVGGGRPRPGATAPRGGQGHLPLEGPAVVGALAVLLEGGQLEGGQRVGVVDPAVGDLDLDLAGVEVAQLDEGAHGDPDPEQALLDAVLDPAHRHPRPGGRGPPLPGGQLPGRGEVLGGQPPRGRRRGPGRAP